MFLELCLGSVAFLLGCKLLRLGLFWCLFWLLLSCLADIISLVGYSISYLCSRFAQLMQKASPIKEIKPGDGCVLITGASSGLGHEMALEFLRLGFTVTGVGFTGGKVLKSMKQQWKMFDFVEADLSKEEGVEKVIKSVENVSILINCAGISFVGRFQDQIGNESNWNKHYVMMGLNMRAYIRLTQAFLPAMIKKQSGRIFAMGSVVGYGVGPNNAMYHGTKAFVNNFFTSLWYDLQGTGVGVTLGTPGATETAFKAKGPQSFIWKVPGATCSAKDVAKDMVAATLAGKKRESGSLLWQMISIVIKLNPEFFNAMVSSLAWGDKIDIRSLQPDLDGLLAM
jgi:short-subunit dehydrogenase